MLGEPPENFPSPKKKNVYSVFQLSFLEGDVLNFWGSHCFCRFFLGECVKFVVQVSCQKEGANRLRPGRQ